MKTSELIKMLQNNMQVEGDVEIYIHDILDSKKLEKEILLDLEEDGRWVIY